MDEYKPINVHGILLTAVHYGGTGEEYYFPDESLLLPSKQQLHDLGELDRSGTLATTGPAMIIKSVIRIRH